MENIKLKIAISALISVFAMPLFAQQDAMFTHYMYNTMAVNPAYAGSREALTISSLHRSQWVGFNGAPVTQTLTMHTPLSRPELGFGLSVMNDKIGPTQLTSIFGDFSYTIKMQNDAKLSFGLKAGANIMQVNLTSLELTDQSDVAFQNNIRSKFLPNLGTGVYYHSDKYYIGISTPKIMQNNFADNYTSVNNKFGKEKRHYFIIAGTVLDVDDNIKFKPTTYIKTTAGAPVEVDLNGIFIFNDKFWAGGMFRTSDAFGALLGVYAMPNMEIGYSFDWSYGLNTSRYNFGSHEIMLRYDFVYKNQAKIRSPRYF